MDHRAKLNQSDLNRIFKVDAAILLKESNWYSYPEIKESSLIKYPELEQSQSIANEDLRKSYDFPLQMDNEPVIGKSVYHDKIK